MNALGRLWAVKLILASDHVLSEHWIFRAVRHPNYLLAIIPELLGLALSLHAFYTLAIIGTLYVFPLQRRIREEDSVMKNALLFTRTQVQRDKRGDRDLPTARSKAG